MAITKIQSESLNLADTYDFTGTVTGAGEKNSPCFFSSYTGTGVEISHATWTKGEFTTEVFDEGSVYDTSNKRYTPGFVGKSFISMGLWFYDASANIDVVQIAFYKNGTSLGTFETTFPTDVQRHWMTGNIIVDHNATDYFEGYIRGETSNGGNLEVPASSGSSTNWRNYFQGFKVFT
jgi:hypothetical protein